MTKGDKTKRVTPRQKMVVDLSKHLVQAENRLSIRCIAVDISVNGMGLISFEALAIDIDAILILEEREISLKVKWCKPDSVRSGVFHIGLGTDDSSINLVNYLEKSGLIKNGAEEAPKKITLPLDEVIQSTTFVALRDSLATCRTTDPAILRMGRLIKLADIYNAFPIRFENSSLCVLLPKGLKPSDAAKLDDAGAVGKKIFVINSKSLQIIWPAASSIDKP
jgi:hypothetical protein